MGKYRWCLLMTCLVSYGLSQIIKTEMYCGRKFSSCTKPLYRQISLECQSHHVILLTDVSFVTFNETEERTCCEKLPNNYCIADRSTPWLDSAVLEILDCNLKAGCYLHSLSREVYGMTSLPNNCSATSSMLYFNYICTTNSSVVNMTKSGENETNGEISLTYSWLNYPRFNGPYYCLCEIKAGDDVNIYPTLYYLHLQVHHRSSVYLYTRNQKFVYDTESNSFSRSNHIFYERFHHLRGPLYLVYAGYDFSAKDKLWVSFKVIEGKMKTRCEGCKKGKFTPPQFKGNVQIIEKPNTLTKIDTKSEVEDSDSTYRIVLITLVVVSSLAGNILTIVFIICRKKRRGVESGGRREATVSFHAGENRRYGRPNRERIEAENGARRGLPTVTVPNDEKLHYDSIDRCSGDYAN